VVAAQLAELPTLAIDDPVAYDRLKDRVRVLVAARVPPGPTVVVSKGDEELLALHDRRGEHFPQDEAGRFTSAHPADGVEAVEQLQAFVARGARQLLIPATSFWWFAHYAELTAWLEARATLSAYEAGTAAVFDLGPGPVDAPGGVLAHAPAGPPERSPGWRAPAGGSDEPRVLYLCHNHPVVRPAGAENYALEVHRAMAREGAYEPWFVARTGPPMAAPREPGTPVVTEVPGHPDELLLHTDVGDWDDCSGRCATAASTRASCGSC
jgi:hypothetical protein